MHFQPYRSLWEIMTCWVSGFLAGVLVSAGVQAQVLFEARPDRWPTDQGWSYAAVPGLAQQQHLGHAVRLLTTTAPLEAAGYARQIAPPLDRRVGFNLVLRFRLPVEQHARNDRAGFSVILLDAERRGIELGFWTNQVFAQADQPLFTRAESAPFVFAADPVEIVLSLHATHYRLFANGTPLLTGPVRDYTAFTGFPDVYETPNFIFLGDDTTSAAAEVELAEVALIHPLRLSLDASGRLTWSGVPGQAYTMEVSRDCREWTPAGRITSTTGEFVFPNPPEGGTGFFRVVHP